MKNERNNISRETYEKAREFLLIGNRAVREAQAENHRLGLPNIYSIDGRIVYEMPNGEIIIKKSSEDEEISEDERRKLEERLKSMRENPDDEMSWEEFKKRFTKPDKK